MKKVILSLSLLIGAGLGAQELPKCHEHVRTQQWLEENPDKVEDYYRRKQEFNDYVQEVELANDSRARGVVYTIPIVFHVIHDYGESNISDAQIYDAVEILNRDFRLQNNDANAVVAQFQGLPADCEIEFALATKKPNGTCFNGITRTASTATSAGESQQISAVQSAHGNFPGDEYLNVFVVTSAGGAAGYTTQPWWGADDMQRGIYITHPYLGSIGTGNSGTSRALTHEVGHWLNLDHTWGGNNNPGVSCGSDNVSDTPETIGWTSCTLNGTTCNGQLDNVENYMEYSYCSKMFTPGQKTRMRAALTASGGSNGNRANLWQPANLAATGADGTSTFCQTDFIAEKNYVCEGGTIQFTDLSYNSVNNWSWNITGGTADDPNIANPLVTYNTVGLHPVALTAGDGGTSGTETKNDFIHVMPSTGSAFPYSEDFESYSSFPAAGLIAGEGDHPYQWELYDGVGSSGSKALHFYNFNILTVNLEREFISYPIDLSTATSGSLEFSFKSVYKQKSNMNGSEKLLLYFSDDCGETWTLSRQWFNSQLQQGTENFAYYPSTSGEYATLVHPIPDSYKISNFMYKIVFRNNGGNNLFIDDININYEGNAGVEEKSLDGLSIYPNPFHETLTIKSGTTLDDSKIDIFDVRGKLVKSIKRDIVENIVINTSDLKQGMYIVKIQNNGYSKSFRVVK